MASNGTTIILCIGIVMTMIIIMDHDFTVVRITKTELQRRCENDINIVYTFERDNFLQGRRLGVVDSVRVNNPPPHALV